MRGYRLRADGIRAGVFSACLVGLAGVTSAEEAREMDEIIVSATRSALAIGETPVAAFVVNRKQIENSNAKNIDELVRGIPGAFAGRTKGPMDTTPAITLRGVPDAKRTLILYDGLPMNDGYSGAQKPMGMSVDDIERVEVVLGPSSSLYGNNAMGGVVSFIPRMPKEREFRYRVGVGDSASGDRGMADLQRAYMSYGDRFENGLKIFASASGMHTNGYVAEYVMRAGATPPTGTTGAILTSQPLGAKTYIIGDRGRTGATEQQVALRGEMDFGSGTRLRLSYTRAEMETSISEPDSYLRNASGLPVLTAPAPNSVAITTWAQGFSYTQRDMSSATLDTAIGESAVRFKVGRTTTDYWYISSGAFNYWAHGSANVTFNPSETRVAEAQVTTSFGQNHTLVWGAAYQQDEASARANTLNDWHSVNSIRSQNSYYHGRTRTLGLFAQDEWQIGEATRAYIGARLDFWSGDQGLAQQATPAINKQYESRTARALSPRLGLVHTVSPVLTLRTSLGTAVRAPNVYDLYRPFSSTSASGTYYANNPDLEPETMQSWDFGTDLRPWDGGELKVSVFFNRFKDFMYYSSVSAAERATICPGIGAGTTCVQKQNVGASRSEGAEFRLNQRFNANISGFVSATLLRSEITENKANPATVGKKFTATPHTLANVGLDLTQGPWSATLSGRYVGRQYGGSDDTNSQRTWGVQNSFDAHTIFDLKLGYRFDKRMKISLAVDNLADREGFNYFRMPGRSWFADLSGEF
jgi:iron complex outermembrane receptor protein